MKSKKLLIGFLTVVFTVGVFMLSSSVSVGQALGLNWTSLGPDNYAGRTRALLLWNKDSQNKTLFAGSVSGGLWKSTTNGLTWNQINTDNVVLNVSCMAQAPNGDIYVGTGETFASERFNLYSGFIGQGIYKSSDGATFTRLSSTNPGTFNNPDAEWAFINKIAAGDNNRVYAALNNGLRVSTDGGQTWVIAKSGDLSLTDISTEVVVASDGTVAASVGNKVYISNDGSADNFALVSGGTGTGDLPHNALSRIVLGFSNDASTIYAMLIGDGSDPAYYRGMLTGIYVSKDKGQSWRLIAPGGSQQFSVFGSGTNHYGDYAASIAVSPTNPDKLYIGGMNIWEGTKLQEEGFYQWQLKTGTSVFLIHNMVIDPSEQIIYISTDQGIYNATNDFSTVSGLNRNYRTSMFYTVAYDDKGRVLGGTQGNGVLYIDGNGNTPEAGNTIYSAFQGGSVEMSMINPHGMFYSSAGGNMIRSADLGVSAANAFVPEDISNLNANVLLTPFRMWENFNNANSRDSVTFIAKEDYASGETVQIKSKTSGFPFNYTLDEPLANGDSIIVQDIISSRFFLGVTGGLYMTKEVLDFGAEPQWFKIANIGGVPTSIGISKDANYVYVGCDNGNVYRVANIAFANDSIKADISSNSCIISTTMIQQFAGRKVTSVSVDQKNDARVLVTLGGYGNDEFVFFTSNALDQTPTFISVQGNLPKMPVYSSLFEMNTSNVLIGTDFGIYTTKALGANTVWTAENNGMGALPILSIRQQTVTRPYIEGFTEVANRGAIYLASLGNGIFENKLYVGFDGPATGNPEKEISLNIYPNPVSDLINFNISLSRTENVIIKIYDLKGNMVLAKNLGAIQKGLNKISIDAEILPAGSYLLQTFSGNEVQKAKFVVIK
ncbi:MAG TPA: T9SS type A sorting domain-containing protein [Lentimicrobium sp.]|nr:T9SS type A sorting domain-containing protein [Lentimicrobium sp.]